ncbi:hypothetical protein AVEN_73975-1 [Araneus ventricosus]|uniref:Glucose-methanol-choline oxidoreductase C-terminal domain-containing protein n=1 Tax=Araneus ventricosus TaxID=182803 RepID=A0A4Y2L143_ARAVE|nr:hypothetical protein AVEN_73975-1 [Araneus ventricosus]
MAPGSKSYSQNIRRIWRPLHAAQWPMSSRRCGVEAWRWYQLKFRPCHMTTAQNDKASANSPCVSSAPDVNRRASGIGHDQGLEQCIAWQPDGCLSLVGSSEVCQELMETFTLSLNTVLTLSFIVPQSSSLGGAFASGNRDSLVRRIWNVLPLGYRTAFATDDADVHIVKTAIEIYEKIKKQVVVIGQDVDLLLSLNALTPDYMDILMLKEVMEQCVNIVVNTTAFKKLGAKMFTIKVPGCDKYEIYSDNYLRCLAKDYPFNIYHPSGTCKMGDADDETTVVDPKLK